MVLPGRKYSAGNSYRYGFNGKENDKEISEGDQDYGMRIYDGRLGKFLSVDPITKKYPELTPYQFASNRPIDGIDLDGKEWSVETRTNTPDKGGKTEVIYTIKISLSDTKNQLKLSNTESKNTLDEVRTRTEAILGNPNAAGTNSDPIVKVNIVFSDDEGSFKLIARNFVAVSGLDTKTGMMKNSGDPLNVAGITKDMGETQTNTITLALSHSMTIKSGNVVLSSKITNTATIDEMARTMAHELGHSAGLMHPFDENNQLLDCDNRCSSQDQTQTILNNLMNSDGNPDTKLQSNNGKELTLPQRDKINTKVSEQQTEGHHEKKSKK